MLLLSIGSFSGNVGRHGCSFRGVHGNLAVGVLGLSAAGTAVLGAASTVIFFLVVSLLFPGRDANEISGQRANRSERLEDAAARRASPILIIPAMTGALLLAYASVYLALFMAAPTALKTGGCGLDWISAIYFSVVTGTTVGFGDLTPVSDVARVIVTSQILLLVSVLAMFIITITRSGAD